MRGRKKGTPKTGGRPKGQPNKKTRETIEFIKSILDNTQEQIEKDLKAVEPAKRLDFYGKLIEYVVPKRRNMEVELPKALKIEISDYRGKDEN